MYFLSEIVMFVYTKTSSKKRKPNATQRELQASWDAMVKKYSTKKVVVKEQPLSDVYSLGRIACRETPKIPSLPFTAGACFKSPDKVYTGTKIIGIGTMHKSNAVPIFSDDEAKDIASMRR
jgi:hypothetical protein